MAAGSYFSGFFQARDNNDVPLAAGTLEAYVAGVSTHKNLWQNQARTIQHPWPCVLDGNGRATIFFEAGAYDLILKDALGNTIDTLSNITFSEAAVAIATTTGPTYTVDFGTNGALLLLVDATSAAVTVNLPALSSLLYGRVLVVKKIDSSSNTVTVDANGGELIDTSLTRVLRTQGAAMTLIPTVAMWAVSGDTEGSTDDVSVCHGRLTATSGTPVTTADVSGATSIYFTPFKGNRIALYNGAMWITRTFSEITISLAGLVASRPYDVFAYDNAGTVTVELLAWTNDTTRATALAVLDGVAVKSGQTTRRYLGSVFINASGGQTDDTLSKRYIYNSSKKVTRAVRRLETSDSWSYGTSAWQAMNNDPLNSIDIMVGEVEETIALAVLHQGAAPASGQLMGASIGEDATNAPATGAIMHQALSTGANRVSFAARLSTVPSVGRHRYYAIEYGSTSGSAATFYGDNATVNMQSGISGEWRS